MGKRYLIDSNVLIEFSGNLLPQASIDLISSIIDEEFNISFINKIEVLGHPSADKNLRDFINSANIIDINPDITERTIKLRANHSIKLPDAIIAATALEYNLVLLTRNIDDFKGLSKLESENPWSWN